MKLKTFRAALAVFSVCMTLFVSIAQIIPAASAETQSFSDVDYTTPYRTAIYSLKDEGVVIGYGDGTFKPEINISRAEFLKILLKSKNYTGEGNDCFTDVKGTKWYVPYVCQAKQMGFIEGYGDGTFRPKQSITFAEASKIIVNVLELTADDTKDENWYQKYIAALEDSRAIPVTITNFDKKITRGEMSEMVWRVNTKNTTQSSLGYDLLERVGSINAEPVMQSFTSCEDMRSYIEETEATNPKTSYEYEDKDVGATPADTPTSGAELGVAEMGPGGAGEEYSRTNVQVEGVDEADIVKNDGQYIYIIKNNTVRIVKAYPPDKMTELDEITFDDEDFYPTDMYVDGNTLVATGSTYKIPDYWVYEDKTTTPYYYSSVTKVYIFDITDKTKITLRRHLDFEGHYTSSRKIDDVVYVVTSKSIYGYEPMPVYYDSETKDLIPVAPCSNVMYYPRITQSNSYMTVAGIPVTDKDAEISEQVILGYGENIYASRNNLYVTENKYNNYGFGYYDSSQDEKTTIHKFSLNNPEVGYVGSGEVPGTILNQFSMDENDKYFRIATTVGYVWDTENPPKNNLYILNENMEKVGSLEGLAPGETIYSVRFMGDRAYIVTFKKVDPLFVIDTANPKAPKVLGKLKIPGYSDYLHPYDENHILGFGKDAADAGESEVQSRSLDFAWYQGMQIAMFDVTDVSNPKQLHKMVIGDRGTDSDLLWNHKALLFDKAKGFMAFPITLAKIPDSIKSNPETPANTYGDYVFQGAYIFDVSIANGFTLRGAITQYDENEIQEKSGYYWYGDKDIERIIYIGSNFYTISQAAVTANKMDDLSEVKRVELKKDISIVQPME